MEYEAAFVSQGVPDRRHGFCTYPPQVDVPIDTNL